MEGVCAYEFADFLHVVAGADELLACPGVNSVEARPGVFGAGDEHMHLFRSCVAQKADNLPGGGSADYGIVNQGYGFAFDDAADGGHFHPDAQVSHRLGRLDERPGHVDVLQQAPLQWDMGGLGVTHSGAEAGVGDTNHYVRGDGVLLKEEPARPLAELVDVAPFYVAVRAREVDILHRAHISAGKLRMAVALQPVRAYGYQLAWFYIAQELRIKGVQGAGLAGYNVAAFQPPDGKGAEAILVAAGIQYSVCQDYCRERAIKLVGGGDYASGPIVCISPYSYQMGEQFAVRG